VEKEDTGGGWWVEKEGRRTFDELHDHVERGVGDEDILEMDDLRVNKGAEHMRLFENTIGGRVASAICCPAGEVTVSHVGELDGNLVSLGEVDAREDLAIGSTAEERADLIVVVDVPLLREQMDHSITLCYERVRRRKRGGGGRRVEEAGFTHSSQRRGCCCCCSLELQ
jgi:hypothetical protein